MGGAGGSVQRWLMAAEHARELARWAQERAARVPDRKLAERFEREAQVHLGSAECFERSAQGSFAVHELELELAKRFAGTPH